ncbi:glycine-rich domain-containing protein [Aliikangiella coralliicola]|uniref:glycine-rich domain-containing protein n=1 Tax=Aliikangiella coralliicola TaxID=2592383 RepID=UPI001AEFDE04|nr:hypothetical protein [Aliikangiella coralliicola]
MQHQTDLNQISQNSISKTSTIQTPISQTPINLNQTEREIWQRICDHSFDSIGDQLSFTQRLARENRWSIHFAKKAIEEYKRFCLLAVIAGHPITPSIEVDQVWHLHLTYSYDYWEEFCPNVLGKKFHHGPTQGGPSEDNKFREWYQNTLNSYRKLFGEPPVECWPNVNERFKNAGGMVQVNHADVFLISKKWTKRLLAATGIAGIATFVQSTAAATESDSNSAFLVFVLIAFAVVLIVGLAVKHKSNGKENSSGGAYGGCGNSSNSNGDGGCGGSGGCGGGCGG